MAVLWYTVNVVVWFAVGMTQTITGQGDSTCTGEGEVRLVGGVTGFEGRVEICLNNVWGTVCDDRWTASTSEVLCKQIQNHTGHEILRTVTWLHTSHFGQAAASQQIHLDDVECVGNEDSLLSCPHSRTHNCRHEKDIVVSCIPTNISLLQRVVYDEERQFNDIATCMNSSEPNTTDTTSSPGPEISTMSVDGCTPYRIEGAKSKCDDFYLPGVSTIHILNSQIAEHVEIINTYLAQSGPLFDHIQSPACRNAIVRMVCYYYFPPCGNLTHYVPPRSVCESTCEVVSEKQCPMEWKNLLEDIEDAGLIALAGDFDIPFINCTNPASLFEQHPQCCSDAGVDFSGSDGPPIEIIVPVVSVVVVFAVGLAVITAVCVVKRQRQAAATQNLMEITHLNYGARGPSAGSGIPYVRHQGDPDSMLSSPGRHVSDHMESPLTKLPTEYLQEMSEARLLIPKGHISLTQCVGQGEFGIVYRGYLSGWDLETRVVAIKTLKAMFTAKDVNDLMKESLKLKSFSHPNVLNLIGVCIDAGEAPFIVMPYMANGSLLAYLKKERPNLTIAELEEASEDVVNPARKSLLSICLQIAKGMEYLASQRFVHRDLAARNCMIDSDFVIKVADFGLSEDIYARNYFRQGKLKDESEVKLPIRWMSLESLCDGIFNEKTDVWSYGVTCWEVFSLGRTPYPAVDPFTLIKYLEGGQRLDKPSNAACSTDIFDIMLSCWIEQPDNRPTFSDLVTTINILLEALAGYVDFSVLNTEKRKDSLTTENSNEAECIDNNMSTD